MNCSVCGSKNCVKINTYKHYVFACKECNSVTNEKKNRYALEFFIPKSLARKILPSKAYLRLFPALTEFKGADFYSDDAFSNTTLLPWRQSELQQFDDLLAKASIKCKPKMKWLDISGGPGFLALHLKSKKK